MPDSRSPRRRGSWTPGRSWSAAPHHRASSALAASSSARAALRRSATASSWARYAAASRACAASSTESIRPVTAPGASWTGYPPPDSGRFSAGDVPPAGRDPRMSSIHAFGICSHCQSTPAYLVPRGLNTVGAARCVLDGGLASSGQGALLAETSRPATPRSHRRSRPARLCNVALQLPLGDRSGPAEAQLRSAGWRLDWLSVNAYDVPDVLDALTGGVAWFGVFGEVVQRLGAVLDHGCSVLARGGAELGFGGATGGRRCAVGEQWRPGYGARVVAGGLPGGVREVHVERHALAIDQECAERAGGRSDRGRTGRGRHRG